METIFHEKQEGSLCAQHCLNALLQGPYFTAVELAALAQEMDEAERLRMAESGVDSEDYRRFLEQPSGNMDDSGYFSVQVIASALELWGLEMIPYNSTEPRAVEAQNSPAEQKAYICNYRDHWFTIRQVANQWFNLNSLLTGPELISNTYLAMFLTVFGLFIEQKAYICNYRDHWFTIRQLANQWFNLNSLLTGPELISNTYLAMFLTVFGLFSEQKAYICNYRDHWFTIRRLANQWFNLNSLLTGPELISNTYLAMFLTVFGLFSEQKAYICNYRDHWFTIRRLANQWFNLNSLLTEPELISNTYLAMFLTVFGLFSEQKAYICNYRDHWFTIRRLANQWFNLNSLLTEPELISNTYLAMFLTVFGLFSEQKAYICNYRDHWFTIRRLANQWFNLNSLLTGPELISNTYLAMFLTVFGLFSEQKAYICNYRDHWFTIRRLANQWFNLNSLLTEPELISNTYLAMFLTVFGLFSEQKAYICNYRDHWFTIRRLANQWFNLNSLLTEPELISNTYLAMFLTVFGLFSEQKAYICNYRDHWFTIRRLANQWFNLNSLLTGPELISNTYLAMFLTVFGLFREQKAYICNYRDHWFTIRRLANQWFNLNSLLTEPELISNTYLAMFLTVFGLFSEQKAYICNYRDHWFTIRRLANQWFNLNSLLTGPELISNTYLAMFLTVFGLFREQKAYICNYRDHWFTIRRLANQWFNLNSLLTGPELISNTYLAMFLTVFGLFREQKAYICNYRDHWFTIRRLANQWFNLNSLLTGPELISNTYLAMFLTVFGLFREQKAYICNYRDHWFTIRRLANQWFNLNSLLTGPELISNTYLAMFLTVFGLFREQKAYICNYRDHWFTIRRLANQWFNLNSLLTGPELISNTYLAMFLTVFGLFREQKAYICNYRDHWFTIRRLANQWFNLNSLLTGPELISNTYLAMFLTVFGLFREQKAYICNYRDHWFTIRRLANQWFNLNSLLTGPELISNTYLAMFLTVFGLFREQKAYICNYRDHWFTIRRLANQWFNLNSLLTGPELISNTYLAMFLTVFGLFREQKAYICNYRDHWFTIRRLANQWFNLNSLLTGPELISNTYLAMFLTVFGLFREQKAYICNYRDHWFTIRRLANQWFNLNSLLTGPELISNTYLAMFLTVFGLFSEQKAYICNYRDHWFTIQRLANQWFNLNSLLTGPELISNTYLAMFLTVFGLFREQKAYICNYRDHWFTIRRLANQWFNLNSLLTGPELISNTYLAMFLTVFGLFSEQKAYIYNYRDHWFTIRRLANQWFNLNSLLTGPELISNTYLAMFLTVFGLFREQKAYICNYRDHWFTIRRLANQWFNLNSLLTGPELISNTYLAMFLTVFGLFREQKAYICNYRDHWFTIRRLANQWFNLNSLLTGPELISNTYLAMFLTVFGLFSEQKAYICNYRDHWFTIRRLANQWFNLNSLLTGPELISNTYLAMFLTVFGLFREQKAYICNYRDHWFTIRRLANQWFNLNSLLTGPELISNTYLAMFLAQLQQEGYSIFVVCGELPPCSADEALLLRPAVQVHKPKLLSEVVASSGGGQSVSDPQDDSELQKAIRMSLGQDEVVDLVEEDEEEQMRQAMLLSLQSQTPSRLPEVDPVELRQRRLAYLESSGTKVNT